MNMQAPNVSAASSSNLKLIFADLNEKEKQKSLDDLRNKVISLSPKPMLKEMADLEKRDIVSATLRKRSTMPLELLEQRRQSGISSLEYSELFNALNIETPAFKKPLDSDYAQWHKYFNNPNVCSEVKIESTDKSKSLTCISSKKEVESGFANKSTVVFDKDGTEIKYTQNFSNGFKNVEKNKSGICDYENQQGEPFAVTDFNEEEPTTKIYTKIRKVDLPMMDGKMGTFTIYSE